MVSSLNYNPMATSNAAGSFGVTSTGFMQGVAMDDPAVRFALAGGYLDPSETLPMWGGIGIGEYVPGASGTPNPTLGGSIKRAVSLATLTGFSVFNQAHHMINTPQSPVPLALSGMGVHFYRLGSGARIPVACSPQLVNAQGQLVTQQVTWDYTSQQLVPYSPVYASSPITGAVWASTSGGQTTFTTTNDLSTALTAGDQVDISGIVSTGGTGVGYNGSFVVVSVTSSTVVVTQLSASSPGTYSSGGTLAAGGGALPCKILEVDLGGSMTVNYDAVTGIATWNRSGNAALILI